MANFCPIISIKIEHNYFTDGLCAGLVFKPTPISATLMQQHQLMVVQEKGSITLLADKDFSAPIDQDLILRFQVFSQDPHFAFYTQQLGKQHNPPLFFSTQNANDKTLLEPTTFYTPDSLVEPKSTRRVGSIASPCLIIDLHISETLTTAIKQPESFLASNYTIQLTASAIQWKYYFFGDLSNFELEIQDLSSQDRIIFDLCDENVVKNGKSFLSQVPIVMSEAPKQKFQLKDKNNSGKVLVKRLPNAALHLLGKQRNPDGQHVLVAEIYINQ